MGLGGGMPRKDVHRFNYDDISVTIYALLSDCDKVFTLTYTLYGHGGALVAARRDLGALEGAVNRLTEARCANIAHITSQSKLCRHARDFSWIRLT